MPSLKLKPAVFINLAISILAGVFAQLLMKYGMNVLKKTAAVKTAVNTANAYKNSGALTKPVKFLFIVFTNKFVIAGIILYLISMFFWIKVLSKTDLSVAYPFVSLGIVLTVMLAAITLKEPVPPLRWLGIFITLCGVYIIVSSHKEKGEDNYNYKNYKKNKNKIKA